MMCIKYVQKTFFKGNFFVRSEFSCVRSSHDLCVRTHTHSLEQCFPTFFNHGSLTWNQSPTGTPLHFWHIFLNDFFSHLHTKIYLSNQISNLEHLGKCSLI